MRVSARLCLLAISHAATMANFVNDFEAKLMRGFVDALESELLPDVCAPCSAASGSSGPPVSTPAAQSADSIAGYRALARSRSVSSMGWPSASNDVKTPRVSESPEQKVARLLRSDVINAALQGEAIDAKGSSHTHNCGLPLGNGMPCWKHLWEKESFAADRKRFLSLSQEARTTTVFNLLAHCHYANTGDDGLPCEEPQWHYWLGGREVCVHVFLLQYPIGRSTLYKEQRRLLDGCEYAHAKHEEGGVARSSNDSLGHKYMSVVGWRQQYASEVGCFMPDDEQLVVPWRHEIDEWKEYRDAFTPDHAGYPYFCSILQNAREIAHIFRARKLMNFQKCTTCVNDNAAIQQAIKEGDMPKLAAAKARRAAHHGVTRGARLEYHRVRSEAKDPHRSTLSLIIDKWDSDKCCVPWFARSPGHWWTATKHEILKQHVVGVLVHSRPNRHFFFVSNESIKGDANFNIECLWQVLLTLGSVVGLPRTMRVQADNASDNKNWTMMLFFGVLVQHEYILDIYFSFLVVGHTHEDIDQLFSKVSRYFRARGRIMTPQEFLRELKNAMREAPVDISTVTSVADWSSHLRPFLMSPIPSGLQHATVEEEVLVPHTFWIHRRQSDGVVVFHYKELSTDKIWLPPLDRNAEVWETDPDGIELFSRPPPDLAGQSVPTAKFACD